MRWEPVVHREDRALPRLKFVARLLAGGTPSTREPSFWDETAANGIPWATIGDITAGDPVRGTERHLTEAGVAAARLTVAPPGTLLFSMYASLGEVAETAIPCCWNQAILAIVPDAGRIDQRFLKYALRSLRPALRQIARSNTQSNLNAEQVANLPIPIPSLEEQRRVADFLDAEIDRSELLSQAKGRMLTILEERRASVYSAAASGSLAGGDGRQPTGLPWLAELPAHWRIAKLSLVARLGTGHTPSRSTPEYWDASRTIPWITTSDIERFRRGQVDVITETKENISTLGLEKSSAVLHPPGTVALSRTASVGYSVIMGTSMATSQDFVTWTCSDRLIPRFLLICLRAMHSDLVGRLALGSTHKTIYMPDIEALRIPLPPIEEQHTLVEVVGRETAQIDAMTRLIEQQLPLIEERRESLISAAVTGELDPAASAHDRMPA